MGDSESRPVAARFSAAAHRYEQAAYIQKLAAIEFDAWLAQQATATPQRIAEIGCGTGLLTRLLHARYPQAQLHATDLAPAMLAHCRASLPPLAKLQFSICDGHHAVFNPSPDWLVSALCFQWLTPLPAVLAHHLANSRVLAFSLVLDGSFSEWRAAHERVGLAAGLHLCPNYAQLQQLCSQLGASRVQTHRVTVNEHHANPAEMILITNRCYRSDHFSFAHAGIPSFSIAEGNEFAGKPAGYGTEVFHDYNEKCTTNRPTTTTRTGIFPGWRRWRNSA